MVPCNRYKIDTKLKWRFPKIGRNIRKQNENKRHFARVWRNLTLILFWKKTFPAKEFTVVHLNETFSLKLQATNHKNKFCKIMQLSRLCSHHKQWPFSFFHRKWHFYFSYPLYNKKTRSELHWIDIIKKAIYSRSFLLNCIMYLF